MVEVVDACHVLQIAEEALIVLLLRLAPLHFAECGHAWQGHILHVMERVDVFGPYIGLHTHDVGLLFVGEHLGNRIEAIDLLDGDIAADGKGFDVVVLALIVVEVAESRRCHDGMVALTSGFDGTFDATP